MKNDKAMDRFAESSILRLSKLLTLVFFFCLLVSIAIGTYYGGSPSGQSNGKYYLSENKKRTQVSKGVYDLVEESGSLLLAVSATSFVPRQILLLWRRKHLRRGATEAS